MQLEVLLNFLYDHIAKNADSQARLKWAPYTVALWDNRITAHVSDKMKNCNKLMPNQSAIVDFKDAKGRRHGVRITPQAERPIPANPDLVLEN